MLTVISLGAGVQSTAMALMAAAGELTPMPHAAIFADTGAEPAAVYHGLEDLERLLPFPVHRVSAGNLRDEILGAMRGSNRMDGRPPFFTKGGGMLRRQCTQDFKIAPIQRKVRELLGLARGARGPRRAVVEQWIGISRDEAARMKPSRLSYVAHRWPLIERGLTRAGCLRWLAEHGHGRPARSACTFCPYRDDSEWRRLRDESPADFADAVAVDAAIRPGVPGPRRPKGEEWFVHRSLLPLDQVDLRTDAEAGQPDLFNDECEGMCGL